MTKDQIRDKRLQKLYGITLGDYELMLTCQGGVCAICGNPPATRSLSVDHDHKWKYLKIKGTKLAKNEFMYEVVPDPATLLRYIDCFGEGPTRREARKDLKDKLRRASVRGLLDFSCNGGLRKYRDNPEYLENAAKYLRKHQQP